MQNIAEFKKKRTSALSSAIGSLTFAVLALISFKAGWTIAGCICASYAVFGVYMAIDIFRNRNS